MWAVKLHYKKRLLCDVHVYEKTLGYMRSILTVIRTAKEKKKSERNVNSESASCIVICYVEN
jgi:hypothetical protein